MNEMQNFVVAHRRGANNRIQEVYIRKDQIASFYPNVELNRRKGTVVCMISGAFYNITEEPEWVIEKLSEKE